jgi:hypothetical protein
MAARSVAASVLAGAVKLGEVQATVASDRNASALPTVVRRKPSPGPSTPPGATKPGVVEAWVQVASGTQPVP